MFGIVFSEYSSFFLATKDVAKAMEKEMKKERGGNEKVGEGDGGGSGEVEGKKKSEE